MTYKADRNLYLDKDKKNVLEEGDPNIAWQLVAKGGTLADDVAAHYHLGGGANAPAAAPSGEVKCPHCNRTFDVKEAQAAATKEAEAKGDNADHFADGKTGSTAAPTLAATSALQPGSEVNSPVNTAAPQNAPPLPPATQGTVSPTRQPREVVTRAGEPVKQP